jgi:hypothetical protein
MMKKTVASVGIAAAASAGALLLTGSPASAQTTPASARATVTYVQQAQHHGDDRGHGRVHHWHHDGDYYGRHDGDYYGRHDHYRWNRDYDDTRIVISNNNVSING